MRQNNLHEVLKSVCAGYRTKRQMQARTLFSWGTVSNAVAYLCETGVLDGTHRLPSRVPVIMPAVPHGRNVYYTFRRDRNLLLGAEVMPHCIRLLLSTPDNIVLQEKSVQFDPRQDVVAQIAAAVHEVMAACPGRKDRLLAAGIALTGAFDAASCRWLKTPHIPEINCCDLSRLSDELPHVRHVIFEHDIIAKARTVIRDMTSLPETAAFFHIGRGVGMTVRLNGSFWTGARGFAGEIGHIGLLHPALPEAACSCGKYGCLESELSLSGLERFAESRFHAALTSALMKEHREQFEDFLRPHLVQAFVTAANLYDPACMIVGGEALDPFPGLVEAAAEQASARSWHGGPPAGIKTYSMDQCDTAKGMVLGLVDRLLDGSLAWLS